MDRDSQHGKQPSSKVASTRRAAHESDRLAVRPEGRGRVPLSNGDGGVVGRAGLIGSRQAVPAQRTDCSACDAKAPVVLPGPAHVGLRADEGALARAAFGTGFDGAPPVLGS